MSILKIVRYLALGISGIYLHKVFGDHLSASLHICYHEWALHQCESVLADNFQFCVSCDSVIQIALAELARSDYHLWFEWYLEASTKQAFNDDDTAYVHNCLRRITWTKSKSMLCAVAKKTILMVRVFASKNVSVLKFKQLAESSARSQKSLQSCFPFWHIIS